MNYILPLAVLVGTVVVLTHVDTSKKKGDNIELGNKHVNERVKPKPELKPFRKPFHPQAPRPIVRNNPPFMWSEMFLS